MPASEQLKAKVAQLNILIQNLNNETPRGASLISISILDEILEGLLKSFFVTSKVSNHLLSTNLRNFSTRLSLCFALGLIQENEYDEIDALNSIRNAFGHTWKELDFDSPVFEQYFQRLPWLGPEELQLNADKKSHFHNFVTFLFLDLMWRSTLVAKEQRTSKTWGNKIRMKPYRFESDSSEITKEDSKRILKPNPKS